MECGSAWYNASFFFATGCVTEWETNAEGAFIGVHDTFNSEEGLIAMKGMQKLVKSSAYKDSSMYDEFENGAAVLVCGVWGAYGIRESLGDNMGATDLPSFTVDGQTYHLGSFSGNKLMGVKPQTDPKKAAVLHRLAQYLTDEKAQLERFYACGWGPSNIVAQKNEDVISNPALKALFEQNTYATPQGPIHGRWWDKAAALASVAQSATTDQELKDALASYQSAIEELVN